MSPRRALALCLVAAVLAGGCWDRVELEDRGLVLMMGLDRVDGGALRVTLQLAVPGQIPLGPGPGGGGGGGQEPARAVEVMEATGPTLEAALDRLRVSTNKRIFLGHLRVVVVGERLARDGLVDLYDGLRRSPEIRRLARVLVARGEAADLVRTAPRIERVPTRFFIELVNTAVGLGKVPDVFLGTVWIQSSAPGQEAVTPLVEVHGDGARIAGLAVFRGNRMVDALSLEETGLLMMAMGTGRGGPTLFVPHRGGRVAVRVFSSRAQVQPRWDGRKVGVRLVIRAEADVVVRTARRAVNSPRELAAIARTAEAQIRGDLLRLVARTQRAGTDVFGFGEHVRVRLPGVWQYVGGTKTAWERYYPQVRVEPLVHLELRRIGLENR